jgi:hypothetical protein
MLSFTRLFQIKLFPLPDADDKVRDADRVYEVGRGWFLDALAKALDGQKAVYPRAVDFVSGNSLAVAFAWAMAVRCAVKGEIRIGKHDYAFSCDKLAEGRLFPENVTPKLEEGTLYFANEGRGNGPHPQVDLFFLAERLGTNQKCLVVVDFTGSAKPKDVKDKARKARKTIPRVTSGAQEDIPNFPNGVKQMTYVIVPTVEKEWFRLKAKANNENANNEKVEGKVDEWADEEYDEEVDDEVDDNAEVACVVGGDAARRLMGPLVPVASLWVDHPVRP